MRFSRGFSVGSFLLLILVIAAVVGGIAYGPAWIDRFEVRQVLREGANEAYRDRDDHRVKAFILRRLHQTFDQQVEENGRTETRMRIDLDPEDLTLDRFETPPRIEIVMVWSHAVRLPFVEQERTITFTDRIEQDLSNIKW